MLPHTILRHIRYSCLMLYSALSPHAEELLGTTQFYVITPFIYPFIILFINTEVVPR